MIQPTAGHLPRRRQLHHCRRFVGQVEESCKRRLGWQCHIVIVYIPFIIAGVIYTHLRSNLTSLLCNTTLTNTHCTVRKWCGGVGAGRRGSRLFQDSAHGVGHAARGPNIAEFRAVEVREPLNQTAQALVGYEGRR